MLFLTPQKVQRTWGVFHRISEESETMDGNVLQQPFAPPPRPVSARSLARTICLISVLISSARDCAWASQRNSGGRVKIEEKGPVISIETEALTAEIHTGGYVSGVAGGTLLDKKTGARDLGFGLDIVDFLLEPKWDEADTPPQLLYLRDEKLHGNLPKRYVELPQICTQAKKIEAETYQGKDFVAVRQSFRYTTATHGRKPGSLWEQVLVFPSNTRYFFASDRITSANDVDRVFLRIDMPGHVKHRNADTFSKIYLSHEGEIPATDFLEDFPPDGRHFYHRKDRNVPSRFIRAYRIRGQDSPWLAGMTLNPASVYEAWCHQRGYVCFIQEIGGKRVRRGEAFGAAYVIGFFDSVKDMEKVYDEYRGWDGIEITPGKEGQPAAFRWIKLPQR
jgi:hypothetical protein